MTATWLWLSPPADARTRRHGRRRLFGGGPSAPPDRIRFALPADQTVRAEAALREFFQTLAQTFANLPIGLAVFDRDRRLQLFNPALTDLTALRAEFLSARPTLTAVLDAMRDQRMLPEPRDYKRWRQRISAIDTRPETGGVEEVWALPGDIVYRVTVRPHPEGALALLIEDISDSFSRIRTLRADAALARAALDMVDEAVAVFDRDGGTVFLNDACRALWSDAPAPRDAAAAVAAWAADCAPDPVWSAIATRLRTPAGLEPFEAAVQMRRGLTLRCRIAPLPAGGRIVRFSIVQAAARATAGALRPAHA